MDYNFEQFKDFKGKFKSTISLGIGGSFGFSSGFMERHKLNNCHYIKIFYDKDNKVVAFQFFENETEGAVKFRNRGKGAIFKSSAFLSKYNIDEKEYFGKYEPEEINNETLGKMYIIKIKSNKHNEVDVASV